MSKPELDTSPDPSVGGSRPIYVLAPAPASLDELGRNTVGGRPIFAVGQRWPQCHCGARMTFFFQVDIPEDVVPFGTSHLLVFQCPHHNDAAELAVATEPLAPGWWDQPEQFWRVLLNQKGAEVLGEPDPHILPARLVMRREPERVVHGVGRRELKIGGVPSWCQDPERYTCACGGALEFLAMVPENHEFATTPGQAEQPGWFRSEDWALFLGNEVYFLACVNQCDPRAVWPVNQN